MALITGTQTANRLVQASPTADPPSPINPVALSDVRIQTTVIDTQWQPRTSLLTHIEGSSWTVDYYAQVLTTDSDLSGQQLSTSAVYQSYRCIKGLELKVTSPLTTDQEDSTKVMKVNGASVLYPCVLPNEGDMFIADIGEGKRGVFRITQTLKKSIFKEACYEIQYGLDTDATDKLSDLQAKAIETYYFHRDYLNLGKNPLILSNEADVLIDLQRQFALVVKQYFKRFYSQEYKTLMLPAQPQAVYDPFLVDYLLSQFQTEHAPELLHLRKLNVDDDPVLRCDSLWTALKTRNQAYLNTAFQKAGLVSTQTFSADAWLHGIRYSGFRYVVYPADPVLAVDALYQNNLKPLAAQSLQPSPVTEGMNSAMVRAFNLRDTVTEVGELIYPVTQDDYYVFSEHFYTQSTQQSVLESLVWSYLNQQALDKTQLLDVSKQYYRWGLLEQFYYVPILLTAMQAVLWGAPA